MTRCPECPGVNACVPPDGPEDARIYGLGEAPGKDENKKRIPFCGKTGREVNEGYLPLAGLRREDIRINNCISCLPNTPKGRIDLGKAAHRDLLRSYTQHQLFPDLERVQPEIIVAMGAFACHALDANIDLEIQHGFPVETQYGMVFPMYHPAGGIHEPKKMLHIRTDWVRLRKYLRGRLHLPMDEFEGIEDYRALSHPDEVDEILESHEWDIMACDTENKRGGDPFCLTFSITPGTGYLIQAGDTKCLKAYQRHLNKWRNRILWHNWLHDFHVVSDMGLTFNEDLVTDTMVTAFHLGNVPQGLKALAKRTLGCKMTDFDDVVSPHSNKLVLAYYEEMRKLEWDKPSPELIRGDDAKWKVYSPQSVGTKIKVFFTNYGKNEEKDIFEAWDNWESNWDEIEQRVGHPWPGKCISHVPFEQVISYACSDADKLLRIWPLLDKMRKQVRRGVQENWMDAAYERTE